MTITQSGAKLVFVISAFVLVNFVFFLLKPDIYLNKNYNYDDIEYANKKRNWHSYVEMQTEMNRTGPGELGASVTLATYQKLLYEKYGFDALLSDQISFQRSVPDIRPVLCRNMTHRAQLPKVSIIIIFHNERRSVLLRTVHGILNRSPTELVEEIILVDDGSTWNDVLQPLDDYLRLNLKPSKVRLLRLPIRRGVMVARMEGARSASKRSEAFVFMDSHFEVMYNWLPPLLDPIANNPKACTTPAIDIISYSSFEYKRSNPSRGYFDWNLNYQLRSPTTSEVFKPAENYREYVLFGCVMAIGAPFFWDLGGFDEGMELWGSEQFELSFKVWMCGGEVIVVPCSRAGHLFRNPNTNGNENLYGNYSFMDRNYRRLIDVWMDDEHRQYVFKNRPKTKAANPGDISERLAIRERLKCKSFSWMLEHIMPDLKIMNPPVEPADYGNGTLQSALDGRYCLVANKNLTVELNNCTESDTQLFRYTWRCDFRTADEICLQSDESLKRVKGYFCSFTGGPQKWYYDHSRQWVTQVEYNICMVANLKDMRVDLEYCDVTNVGMKWQLGYYNKTANDICIVSKLY